MRPDPQGAARASAPSGGAAERGPLLAVETARLDFGLTLKYTCARPDGRPTSMPLNSSECHASELVHSDTRPRPTTPNQPTNLANCGPRRVM